MSLNLGWEALTLSVTEKGNSDNVGKKNSVRLTQLCMNQGPLAVFCGESPYAGLASLGESAIAEDIQGFLGRLLDEQ